MDTPESLSSNPNTMQGSTSCNLGCSSFSTRQGSPSHDPGFSSFLTRQGSPSLDPGFSSFLTRQGIASHNPGIARLAMDQPQSLLCDQNLANGSTLQNPVNMGGYKQYEPLIKALRSGDFDATKKFLTNHPEAVRARLASRGETALHLASLFGQLNIVEELLQLMPVDDLELLLDDTHHTALHAATCPRNVKIAQCLVEKNRKQATVVSLNGWIPVSLALDYGNTEIARYLYFVTPLEVLLPERGTHGVVLLRKIFLSKMFDIALDLLKRCPKLAVTQEYQHGPTFLDTLATAPWAFLSGSKFSFWQRLIYDWVHIPQGHESMTNEISVSISETNTGENDYTINTCTGLLQKLVSSTLNLLGIKNMYEAKLSHKQSLQILRTACHAISTLSEEEILQRGVYASVLLAAERGIPELIMEATKVHFPLLWAQDINFKRTIFFLAVQFRQAKVFNLVHGISLKESAINFRDINEDYLLHMAGLLAPPTQLNNISGAVLQMQRELQWFKEVESIMPPMRRESLNRYRMTAKDLFTLNHKELVEKGERWTKETASSCTIVAALVATITFAAAFTVPGGNDQNTGYPMFLQRKLFMLFIISDAVSLFSSSTSVLIFLGLLTSRYAEDDFLKSLPIKLIIGLLTLFISTATMMIAFCAALFLVVHGKLWIGIPVTLLASAPVTLFVWLQFPLLVEFIKSTYGPGIFDRNVKPWA